MSITNKEQWIEVDVEGEATGDKYFGKFLIKPYLTHAERSDAVRLSERLARGIDRSQAEIGFLTVLSFVKFHIIESDAAWWTKDSGGLDLYDENPIYEISKKIGELQKPKKKTEPATPESTEGDPLKKSDEQ